MNKITTNIVIGVTVIGALISGYLYFHHLAVMPSTDDGYVEADIIQVAAQVAGPITKSPIKNDTFVKKGDLLLEIDPKPFLIAVDEARAALAQTHQDVQALVEAVKTAQADVDSAKAGVDTTESEVKSSAAALDKADKAYARQKRLKRDGATSTRAVESAEASFKEARASDAQAKSEVGQSRAALRAAAAKLAQAQAELGDPGEKNARILVAQAKLADAELDLSYTKVTVVEDGFVSGLNLPPGNYVAVGTPLFTLITNNTWRIGGNFLETDLARIKPGQNAFIRLQAYPGHRLKGVVAGISWGIAQQAGDAQRGALPNVTPTVDWVRLAQRFPVKVKFVDLPPDVELRVGMNGNVQIDTTTSVSP
jgi:membrane fusion protein (multidrug efflux system)